MPEPTPPPSCVLLLSLWRSNGTGWHVRLIGADARVHEFDSPFELARFLAQPPRPPQGGSPGGLR